MKDSSLPHRVHYFPEQYLRLNEFVDEQAYHVAARRRHNIGHHSWGIVAGLELVQQSGLLMVRPGMAIDGYGRELVLSAPRPISTEEFQRLGSNRLDVWLHYDHAAAENLPAGYGPCGEHRTGFMDRLIEQPRLSLERAGVSRINARRPKAVPPVLLDAPAPLATPDDPLVMWPVYLGRLTYIPEEPDLSKSILIDASDRLYAGVMATVIDHPATAARIELGRTSTQSEERQINGTTYKYTGTGSRLFAVFVPPGEKADTPSVSLEPRFEIHADGTNYLRGATTVHGHVRLAGGAVQFSQPVQPDPTVSRNDPSIYRSTDGANAGADELRIDLGMDVQHRSFVIGFTADDGSFKPTIKLEYKSPGGATNDQPLLTIFGDLKMEGVLLGANILERPISEETLQSLIGSFQAGAIAAGRK
jgi:hypothetical protein